MSIRAAARRIVTGLISLVAALSVAAPLAAAAAPEAAPLAAAATEATTTSTAAPAALSAPGVWHWTPETIVGTKRLSAAEISPDGTRIVYVATRMRPADAAPGNAYSSLFVVAANDSKALRRLTAADAEDKSPSWSPDGKSIAFLSARGDKTDKGEKPKTRLWIIPADGGEARPITGDKIGVESFAWSRDGQRIAYVAVDPKTDSKQKDEKAGRDWKVVDRDLPPRRLWVLAVPAADGSRAADAAPTADATPAAPQAVASLGERSVWEYSWAPDGQAIVAAVSDTPRTDDSYMGKRLQILPLAAGAKARPFVANVGKIGQVYWSLDGATIAWRAGVDASDPSVGSIFVAPAQGGPARNLTGDLAETTSGIVWMEGTTLVASVIQSTQTSLVAIDTADPGSRRVLISAGPLVFADVSASRDGDHFGFAATTATGPAEVYTAPAPAGRAAHAEHAGHTQSAGTGLATFRLTEANPQLNGLPRGHQETFRWHANDGTALEGVLIYPADDGKRASYPLVVVPHGGPESQYLDGWNTSYSTPGQALAERGCYVFYPNYRGSTGRGVAFAKSDHNDLGGREYQDVLDGIDAVATKNRIDPKRIGMTGGSYGGYFTSLAVTRWSDRFAAGVTFFGISDWMSFLGQSDTPVENSLVHWNLSCYEHEAACRDASPIAHIATARTPTLILQGEADLRVPKPQSDQLYAALRWKGVPVDYVVFPREGHGFSEQAHQLEAASRLLGWFEKYLGL